MRTVRLLLVIVLSATLMACTPAAPLTVPEPAPSPEDGVDAQAGTFEILMQELYIHFLVRGPNNQTQYISAEATPAQGTAELNDALDLGEHATYFTLATATELARTAAASTAATYVTEADLAVREVEVLGEHEGRLVLAITLNQELRTQRGGPVTRQEVTYATTWDGATLHSVSELLSIGSEQGLDSGTGLSSPLGAVRRYVELVEDRDFSAIAVLSGGENDDEIALEVLASVVDSSEHTNVVALPQATEGSQHLVYLINAAGMVIGRFEVTLAEPTEVVYHPTA